jgi:hypothetical protein
MQRHSTSGIIKKENNRKVILNMLTHGAMRGCGLTSWVVCSNDKFHNIRERNVTIRVRCVDYKHPLPRVSGY